MRTNIHVEIIKGKLHQFTTVHMVDMEDGEPCDTVMCGEAMNGMTAYEPVGVDTSIEDATLVPGVKQKRHLITGCFGCLMEFYEVAKKLEREVHLQEMTVDILSESADKYNGIVKLQEATIAKLQKKLDKKANKKAEKGKKQQSSEEPVAPEPSDVE